MDQRFQLPAVAAPEAVAAALADCQTIRLLDVRTAAEFETIHIPGAHHVPLDALAGYAHQLSAEAEVPLVLVCRSGQRARKAATVLKSAGLTRLHLLDGGVNGWVAAGLPVQRGRERISLERQVRIAAGALAAAGGLLAAFVNPTFGLVAVFVGGGLVFAGVTDSCAMGMLLSRLPYNRQRPCDVRPRQSATPEGSTERRIPARQTCCQ